MDEDVNEERPDPAIEAFRRQQQEQDLQFAERDRELQWLRDEVAELRELQRLERIRNIREEMLPGVPLTPPQIDETDPPCPESSESESGNSRR